MGYFCSIFCVFIIITFVIYRSFVSMYNLIYFVRLLIRNFLVSRADIR